MRLCWKLRDIICECYKYLFGINCNQLRLLLSFFLLLLLRWCHWNQVWHFSTFTHAHALSLSCCRSDFALLCILQAPFIVSIFSRTNYILIDFFLFFGIIKLADRNLYRSFSFFPIVKTTFPKLHTHIHIEKHTAPFSSHLFTMKIFEFKLNQIKKKSVWKFEPTNQHSMEEKRASSMQKSEHTEWEIEIESKIGNHADPSKRSHGRLLFYANHSWLNWFILFVWVTFVYIFKSILIFNSCIANSSLLFTFFPFFIYTK